MDEKTNTNEEQKLTRQEAMTAAVLRKLGYKTKPDNRTLCQNRIFLIQQAGMPLGYTDFFILDRGLYSPQLDNITAKVSYGDDASNVPLTELQETIIKLVVELESDPAVEATFNGNVVSWMRLLGLACHFIRRDITEAAQLIERISESTLWLFPKVQILAAVVACFNFLLKAATAAANKPCTETKGYEILYNHKEEMYECRTMSSNAEAKNPDVMAIVFDLDTAKRIAELLNDKSNS